MRVIYRNRDGSLRLDESCSVRVEADPVRIVVYRLGAQSIVQNMVRIDPTWPIADVEYELRFAADMDVIDLTHLADERRPPEEF